MKELPAAERKRLLEQAARDKRIEAEFKDYDSAFPHMSPERVLLSTSAQFNITVNGVLAALKRRAELKGEEFIDPRTL